MAGKEDSSLLCIEHCGLPSALQVTAHWPGLSLGLPPLLNDRETCCISWGHHLQASAVLGADCGLWSLGGASQLCY